MTTKWYQHVLVLVSITDWNVVFYNSSYIIIFMIDSQTTTNDTWLPAVIAKKKEEKWYTTCNMMKFCHLRKPKNIIMITHREIMMNYTVVTWFVMDGTSTRYSRSNAMLLLILLLHSTQVLLNHTNSTQNNKNESYCPGNTIPYVPH